MYEPQNCYRQGYQKSRKILDDNAECDETSFDDIKDIACNRDARILNSSSCECSLKKSRGGNRDYLRMIASADQQLDMKLQRSQTKKYKSRSPLTFPKSRKSQQHQNIFNFETCHDDFGAQQHAYCLDSDKAGIIVEKSSKRLAKDRTIVEHPEMTKSDKSAMTRVAEKRENDEKHRYKNKKYLNQLEDLKNQLSQFKFDKKRKSSESKICQKNVTLNDFDEDNGDEEEECKLLEEDLAEISVYDSYPNSKHLIKIPDTIPSFTDTSDAEDVDGKSSNNIQRVIDNAIMRENASNGNKGFQPRDDDLMSSEGTISEDEDTLRGSPHQQNNSQYINHLKTLRLRYLHHIQDELNHLFDLEQLFESLTSKNSKSDEKTNVISCRPITRAAGLQ